MSTLYGMDFSDPDYVRSSLFRMVLFFAGYVLFYKVLRKKLRVSPESSPEYSCRTVTFAHGVICCYAAIYYIVLPAIRSEKGETVNLVTISCHTVFRRVSYEMSNKLISDLIKVFIICMAEMINLNNSLLLQRWHHMFENNHFKSTGTC